MSIRRCLNVYVHNLRRIESIQNTKRLEFMVESRNAIQLNGLRGHERKMKHSWTKIYQKITFVRALPNACFLSSFMNNAFERHIKP